MSGTDNGHTVESEEHRKGKVPVLLSVASQILSSHRDV